MSGRSRMDRYVCVDCGVDTDQLAEYFMLLDSVWAETGLSSGAGMLCIGCTEQRIGRTLVRADFTTCRLNDEPCHVQSERLRTRLAA